MRVSAADFDGMPGRRDPNWFVTRDQYLPQEDGLYESLFALTNGRVGIRATVDYEAGEGYPGCFFSGFYGRGLDGSNELINAVNLGYWSTRLNGNPLRLSDAQLSHFRQSLDLLGAVVRTQYRVQARTGTVSFLATQFLPGAAVGCDGQRV